MISVGIGHVSFFSVTWISPGRDENAEPTDLREQHALGLHWQMNRASVPGSVSSEKCWPQEFPGVRSFRLEGTLAMGQTLH